MSNHICFETIECRDLYYVVQSESWVCLRSCTDLKHVDSCMSCRFLKMAERENEIRNKVKHVTIL